MLVVVHEIRAQFRVEDCRNRDFSTIPLGMVARSIGMNKLDSSANRKKGGKAMPPCSSLRRVTKGNITCYAG
jgi:hypothetical protein